MDEEKAVETVEIFFNNLSKAKRKEILRVAELEEPDPSWEFIPIAMVVFQEEK